MGEVHVDEVLLFIEHIIQCRLNVSCNRMKIRETLAVIPEDTEFSSVNGEKPRVKKTAEDITSLRGCGILLGQRRRTQGSKRPLRTSRH